MWHYERGGKIGTGQEEIRSQLVSTLAVIQRKRGWATIKSGLLNPKPDGHVKVRCQPAQVA
jgi:hypothetical protein